MTDPILATDGITRSFGALVASKDITLDLRPGEIHALIGPNGAGKSTLIQQIAGGLRPDSGRVLLGGADVTHLGTAARARRAQEETTIIGASAASVAYGDVEATWEVQRFVDLKAVAAYERRAFRGAGRRDKTLVLGIGAEWRARETTTLSAGYRYVDENSNAPGESSRANLVWLAVEHRF